MYKQLGWLKCIFTLEKASFPLMCKWKVLNRKVANTIFMQNYGIHVCPKPTAELSEHTVALKWTVLAVYVFLVASKLSVFVLICLCLWNNLFNVFLSFHSFLCAFPQTSTACSVESITSRSRDFQIPGHLRHMADSEPNGTISDWIQRSSALDERCVSGAGSRSL